jgi:hypothetical protein
MLTHYDRTGAVISEDVWKANWSDANYRTLARTDVGEWTVAAWWAGIDDSGGVDVRIFRSALLVRRRQGASGSPLLQEWRHRTAEEALVHHNDLVARLRDEEAVTQAVALPPQPGDGHGCHCH